MAAQRHSSSNGDKKDHDLNIEEITTIEVNIFKRAIDLISNNYPQNPIQAQFHLPYCIAIGILFNEVTPKNFIEANLNNSKVLSLIDKTIIKKMMIIIYYFRSGFLHVL